MGFIYKLTFASGKSYIGQTRSKSVNLRIVGHAKAAEVGSVCAVHAAWRKYGTPKVEVLGEFPNEELNAHEKRLICEHKTFPGGYNMTAGGETSPMSVPEIALRAGMSNKGQKRPLSFCLRMKEFHNMPEVKLAKSIRMEGNKFALGKKQSEDTKAKKSASLKGKNKVCKKSAEQLARHSITMKGNQHAKGKNLGNQFAKGKNVGNQFAKLTIGMFWITNGSEGRKIRDEADLPEGWSRGRTRRLK